MSTTTAPVSYYDDPTPNPTSDDLARAAAADERASDVDEFARRVDDLGLYAMVRRGGGATWAECSDLFGLDDFPTEPGFPEWLYGLPGLDTGPEAIAEYLAAAPLNLDPEEHDRLRALLRRVTAALGTVGSFGVTMSPLGGDIAEEFDVDGGERLAFSLIVLGLRLAALEAVHYDGLPAEASNLHDDCFELLYGARAEYARDVTEDVLERFLADLEAAAGDLLERAAEFRAAAAEAATEEEAAELRAAAEALEAPGRAILAAVRRDRRARRSRHRRPATRRRTPRCALRGSPATVTRCPAAPHGPPTRAPRVRHAATVA